MPIKRPSLVGPPKVRPNLGTPYQIYTELVNTGKSLTGTKKRVKWRVGWSESNIEHEIEFVHSVMSGKKTITENGVEITTIQTVSTDFNHGWNAESCAHVFRIEANLGITTEHTYIFSIDGVSFLDMARKPADLTNNSKTSDSKSGFGSKESTGVTSAGFGRESVRDPFSKSPASNRNSTGGRQQSLTGLPPPPDAFKGFSSGTSTSSTTLSSNSGQAFDPFDASPSGFDPFSSEATPFDPFSSEPVRAAAPAAPTAKTAVKSLFGEIDDRQDSHSDQQFNNTASTAFDPFSSSSNVPINKSDIVKADNKVFDMFSSEVVPSNPFESNAAFAPTVVVRKQNTGPLKSSFSTFDAFSSNPSATHVDPFFAPSPTSTSSVSSSAGIVGDLLISSPVPASRQSTRRQSAHDIILDFAGLSLPATATFQHSIQQQSQQQNSIKNESKEETIQQQNEAARPSLPVDPWSAAGSLVNLDLTAQNQTKDPPSRRSSVRGSIAMGPSGNNSVPPNNFDNINPFVNQIVHSQPINSAKVNSGGIGGNNWNAISGMQESSSTTTIVRSAPANPYDAFQGLTGIGAAPSSGTVAVRGSFSETIGSSSIMGQQGGNQRMSINYGSPAMLGGTPSIAGQRNSFIMSTPRSNFPSDANNSQIAPSKSSLESFDWRS